MAKKVTMRDLATKAGVSQSTVSIVLNGSTSVKIASSTKKKVLDAAESLGYKLKKPVLHAEAPKKIAMVINGLTNYDPFIDAVNAARAEAWANDYILSTFTYDHDEILASAIEKEIECGGYSGLIYSSSMTRDLQKQRVSSSLPTVLLNCTNQQNLMTPSILPADMIGAYKAVNHLIQQGYRRIAMLTGESWMKASEQRAEGYRQALIDSDIIPNDTYVLEANWSLKEARSQTLKLLKLSQPPEAIFCCNDYMALGCYQAILEQGLHVPNDVAVVGYDNQLVASDSFPTLSSVELPYSEMGKIAVEYLLAMISKQPSLLTTHKVEGELVVRQSSNKKWPQT